MARLLIYGKGGRQIVLCLTDKLHTPKVPPLKHNSKTLCEHLLWLLLGMALFMTNSFRVLYPHFTTEASVSGFKHLLSPLRNH